MNTRLALITATLLALLSCAQPEPGADTPPGKVRLLIHAAAGARTVTEHVCTLFERTTGYRVERNYASSGTLARQIANGVGGDVFISANPQWMALLQTKQLLIDSSIRAIAGNTLAVIAPAGATTTLPPFERTDTLAAVLPHRIALGDPAYVPVGAYAKSALSALGWFEPILARAVLGKDVAAVLRYVELGECDWGFVYKTEALGSSKVRIMAELPPHLHAPIVFSVARITGAQSEATRLAGLFSDSTGQALLSAHGFTPLSGEDPHE